MAQIRSEVIVPHWRKAEEAEKRKEAGTHQLQEDHSFWHTHTTMFKQRHPWLPGKVAAWEFIKKHSTTPLGQTLHLSLGQREREAALFYPMS